MDDDDARIAEINRDPRRIHGADEMWTAALNHLAKIIAYIKTQEPDIYENAGENTDASVLFDWLKGYILVAERNGGRAAHEMTMLMAAAALTKLVREDRTTDATLAQLDWKETENDDHN